MKRKIFGSLVLGAILITGGLRAQGPTLIDPLIRIKTDHTVWLLRHEPDGTLSQLYYGAAAKAPPGDAYPKVPFPLAHPAYGEGFVLEPALRISHADGNTSTDLRFATAKIGAVERDENVAETRVELHDPAYSLTVTLCFRAYQEEDVIEHWVKIRHDEPGEIILHDYASSIRVGIATACRSVGKPPPSRTGAGSGCGSPADQVRLSTLRSSV